MLFLNKLQMIRLLYMLSVLVVTKQNRKNK